MRATVDDRLTKTLNDRLSSSFKQIDESLEAVYRGLGDMKSLAAGVGDLKKTLSNVKTRGILGEVQLGAILSEVFAPAQYAENVATKPGSADRVEFAVKLPVEEGEPVWLPIDAKFPGDTYAQLRDALDSGDREAIVAARKQLETRIKAEARDISTKYVSVPATTNFGIMFLPFEGLYAEVVSMPGSSESLQRDWHVNVAGPSTMAALLSDLEMAYQTFNLQRRTDEVLRVLQAVKAELPRSTGRAAPRQAADRPRRPHGGRHHRRVRTSWSASRTSPSTRTRPPPWTARSNPTSPRMNIGTWAQSPTAVLLLGLSRFSFSRGS